MMAKKDSIDEELSLLDNKCKFNEDLATPQLLLFLKNTKQAEYHTPANIMPKILISMTKCPGKPLQVSLKWLNFIHSGLQVAKCSSLAENLMDLLPKLDSLAARNKYEQYMILKLVRPYRQYLGKLGRIVIQKLRGPSPSRLQDTLGLLYCEFNLLLFACEEFTECSREFYGYFKRFFPCLNGYIGLLIRDMHRIFKKIKLSSERKTLQNVSDLEIEMIQSKIAAFGRLGQGKDVYGWLFAQTSGKSETVQSPKSEAEDLGETEQSDWGVAVSYFQS